MTTQFDQTFFKIAVYNKVTDQATADRCLQYIAQAAQSGKAYRAPDVFLSLGTVDRTVIDRLNAMTMQAVKARGVDPAAPAAPAQPAAPPPTPAAPPPPSPAGGPPPSPSGGRSSRHMARPGTDAARTPANLPAQLTADQIDVSEKIGEGTVGGTWKGKETATGQTMVFKVLTSKFQSYPPLLKQIVDDLKRVAAADLKDPAIVQMLAPVDREGRIILPFEFVDAQPLSKLLAERGKLPPATSVRIALTVAKALDQAHAKGVMHGDLRPRKILIEPRSSVIAVTDFGLSRAAALSSGFARYGIPFGHPAYLAPEVLQSGAKDPGPLGDIYALGILLYQLVCGVLPFPEEDPQALLAAHLKNPIPPPPDGVTLNRKLAELIMTLTAKDPKRRTRTAGEAARALEALLAIDLNVADDPASDEESVSDNAWMEASQESSEASNDWSEEKLKKAASLEPDEWDPDDIEDDPDFGAEANQSAEELRKRREEQSKRLRAKKLGSNVNPDLQNLAELAAVAEKSTSARSKKKPDIGKVTEKVGPGNRFQLQAEANRRKRDRERLLVGAIMFGGVLLMAGAVVGIGWMGMTKSKVKPKQVLTSKVPDKNPEPKPKIKPAKQQVTDDDRQAFSRALDKRIQELKREVTSKRDEKKFPAALAALGQVEPKFREADDMRRMLREYRESIVTAAKKDMASIDKELRAMAQKDAPSALARLKRRYQGRMIEETKADFASLMAFLDKRIEDSNKPKPIADEKLEKWQLSIKKLVFGKVEFRKDRVIFDYDFSDGDQLLDWTHTEKKVAAGTKEDKGLLINQKKAPETLVFTLPVRDVFKVSFDYGAVRGLTKGSRIGVALGLDPFTKSKGTLISNNGKVIKLLGKRERELQKGPAKSNPWEDGTHRFRLGSLRSRMDLRLDGKKQVSLLVREPFEGFLALHVQNLEVRITKVRLEVAVDPTAVKEWARSRGKR